MFDIIFFILALTLFAIICVNDFLFFRIEDSVVIGAILYYLLLFVTGRTDCSIYYSLSAASLFFVTSAALNYFNLIGGGDVKLLFAIGLLVPSSLFEFFCALSVMSLGMVFVYSTFNKQIFKSRAFLAIKVFRLKNSFLKQIFFPSAYKITRKELLEEVSLEKMNSSILRREIPYGVILSISSIVSIGSMLFIR